MTCDSLPRKYSAIYLQCNPVLSLEGSPGTSIFPRKHKHGLMATLLADRPPTVLVTNVVTQGEMCPLSFFNVTNQYLHL